MRKSGVKGIRRKEEYLIYSEEEMLELVRLSRGEE